MADLVVVSFRLGANDGVSIEAAKWIDAFRQLGHRVTTLAGDGEAEVIMPELSIGAPSAPSLASLEEALSSADVVVVENFVSLPLNVAARRVLYRALQGRRALFRHHDLAWQRATSLDMEAPRDDKSWHHVTINDLSREQLKERGIASITMRNSFDCDPPLGRRDYVRRHLGLSDERLFLLASRAIPRKNVQGALQLAESLDAVLWILGPAEDGFNKTLETLLSRSRVRVIRGKDEELSVHDAYAACDLVVVPSTFEGFGNPVLESVTHRRPLAVYPYPVLSEIRAFGFRFFDLNDVTGLDHYLENPDTTLFDHNLEVAREHFNVAHLARRLASLLETLSLK